MSSKYLMMKGSCVQFHILSFANIVFEQIVKTLQKYVFYIFEQVASKGIICMCYYVTHCGNKSEFILMTGDIVQNEIFRSGQADEDPCSRVCACLILCSAPYVNERISFDSSV